jgi:tetratricopeptide (TPR) repeat protein
MPQDQFRIFLSAVTSEFGKARDALGADLRSRDTLLRVQSDFRQEAGSDTTLQKLHDYIRDCSAVVCVIGKRSGALPPPAAAAPFNHMLPSGIATASYTQWEFFFARHFKRRLSIYIAKDDHKPDGAPGSEDDPKLQTAFIAHIVNEQGLDRSYFSNEDQLCRAVLKEDWPKKPEHKPIALPYLSLGSLFKGRDAFLTDLHKSLNRSAGRTAIVGSVLYGLGGIGKTRAAVEYAWAHQENYSALLFVIAETPEALRRNLAALVGVAGWADETITKYPRAVAVTWHTSVKQVSASARSLLERLAWLAPEPVPNLLTEVPVPDIAADDIEEALTDLAAYSLVRRNPQSQEFSIHRLVQDVTRRSLAGEVPPPSLIEALGWINAAFPSGADDVRHWPRAEALAPHAQAVTEHAAAAGIAAPTARLMNQLGVLLWAKALYAEAEPLYRRALAIDEKNYGPDHPAVAIRLSNLALLLGDTNRLSEAESLYRRALAIDENSYGPNHPTVAMKLNNLAELLRNTNRLSEAEPLYRRALAIDEKNYGPDHPMVATFLNNLAELLGATNRPGEAEPLFRRALAIDEKSYGSDHPDVANRLNNLAELLGATNRLSEAEPLYWRAVAILAQFTRATGHQHPRFELTRANYAQALTKLGRSETEVKAAVRSLL